MFRGFNMSLWDFVAAASISTNINDPSSTSAKILKKINSASLTVLNGDSINYVSGGGRTSNTFGASTNFTCDIEALLEGWIAGAIHADPLSKTSLILGGLFLGPGAENKILMGNGTVLTYMPHHSSNFSVYRGGKPETYNYFNGEKIWLPIKLSSILYALSVFGFELLYSMAGAFKKELMSPVGDKDYIKDQKALVEAKEEELDALETAEAKKKKEQQQREASGDVPSPEQIEADHAAEHAAEKKKEELESIIAKLEAPLKTAERQKEWLLYANVILENRGMFLLKMLEKINAAYLKAKTEVENAKSKVDNFEQALITTTNSIDQKTIELSTNQDPATASSLQAQIQQLETAKAELETNLLAARNELANAQKTLSDIPLMGKKP